MTRLIPRLPGDSELQEAINHILDAKPVKNLTYEEVETTLRLLEIESFLISEDRYHQLVIHRNDKRLELCDDNDRFLALLADCDQRDVLLFSGRCRSLFGGSVYHWRNIGRKCPITAVASAISECGSGYYGQGWEIVSIMRNFKATVTKDIETNDDKKGNRMAYVRQVIEGNQPPSFDLCIPIFKGQPKQKFTVEIDIDPDTLQATLVSPDAQDLIAEQRDKLMDDVLAGIKDLCPDIPIIEV